MNIAYLGPSGSYTETAARRRFAGATLLPCASIDAVFSAVSEGSADHGVVPIENMIQGPVTETQDCLYAYHQSVCIHDMLLLAIAHALGVPQGQDLLATKTVLSKDQALKQCSTWLTENLKEARLVEVDSTSNAANRVASDHQPQAAIASVEALEQYGLDVVAKDIGNVPDNKTRFAVLGRRDEVYTQPPGPSATSLVIYPPSDRVGILEEILGVISRDHAVSLSSIHSRPDQRGAFRFFLELEGHQENANVRQCLDSLQRKLANDVAEIVIFGSYPQRPFNAPKLKTIGIVGGTGKMGKWFERFFTEAGYRVICWGRRSSMSLQECVKASQAVLINVPIEHAEDTAREVAALLQPGQLVLDNTSVKGPVMAALLSAVPEHVEVLGMHTIFGPNIDTLRQRNTVFVRTEKSAELAREFERIFYKHGARLTFTDAANHDQQMAFHQNLEHFSKLVLARVLCEHVHEPASSKAYSSPNSRASLRTMARVLDLDPRLLAEIQAHNQMGPNMLRRYVAAANELLLLVEQEDYQSLREHMTRWADQLGPDLLDDLRGDE